MTPEVYEAARDRSRKEEFAKFMAQPTIGLLVSMIPQPEHNGVLEVVLKEAFNTGWLYGESCLSMTMTQEYIETVMKGKR